MQKTKKIKNAIIIIFYCLNVIFPNNLQNLCAKHSSSKTVNGNMGRVYCTKVNFPSYFSS